jgi:hypothetical protein
MATTAEFIGAYIADIITTATLIATTVTITVIVTVATITITAATIITITAIGETYRVVAVSKLAVRRARVVAHAAAFSLFRPRADV